MKVKIKTLTPIHIGTGKKLETLDFYENYRINYDKLFDLIAEEKQEEFFQWIDQNTTTNVEEITKRINVDEINKRFKLKKQDIIKKCGLYSFSESFQKDLNEGIKDSSNKLFIPGSSLKGSLRTALMYKVLSLPNHLNNIKEYLDNLIAEITNLNGNQRKIKNLIKDADDKLEEEVFICGVEKNLNNSIQVFYNDQKFDLMKLVNISDTTSVSTNDYGEITELQVYALREKNPHKSFKIFTESIKKDTDFEFDINIDIKFLKNAKKELNNPNSVFGKKYFIGIEQKLKDLFDIDIKNESDFNEEKITGTLLKSWSEFGETVANIERIWVESIRNKGNANFKSLDKIYSDHNKFKVGFGTGFSGMTILPLLLEDIQLRQNASDFYRLAGIGYHNSSNNHLNIDKFPFTRKYSNKQNIYDGFGWVKFLTSSSAQTDNSDVGQEVKKPVGRPANTVIAEIIDDKSKPPKVKILEGEHINKETILPGITLEGLGLSKGSKIYVSLLFYNNNIQKAEFKGKAE